MEDVEVLSVTRYYCHALQDVTDFCCSYFAVRESGKQFLSFPLSTNRCSNEFLTFSHKWTNLRTATSKPGNWLECSTQRSSWTDGSWTIEPCADRRDAVLTGCSSMADLLPLYTLRRSPPQSISVLIFVQKSRTSRWTLALAVRSLVLAALVFRVFSCSLASRLASTAGINTLALSRNHSGCFLCRRPEADTALPMTRDLESGVLNIGSGAIWHCFVKRFT